MDNITDWGKIWLINFNSHKNKVLFLGTQVFYSLMYRDGLHESIRVEEKDLRVFIVFSSTLIFIHHVKEIVHKANTLLTEHLIFLEPQMLHNLYTALTEDHIHNPTSFGLCMCYLESLSIWKHKDIDASTKKCNASLLIT